MKRRTKNYFIPNAENEYAPHALQKVSVAVMFALVLVSFGVANIQSILWISSDWLVSTVLPSVIVELTNDERVGGSLDVLQRSAVLDEAAQLKAEDMALHEYFAHNSPTGVTPWHWFDVAGYAFVYAGENLAVHFTDSENVVEAWMNSTGHRANILNSNYSEIGVGTAKGEYEGYSTIFVVQLFGTPAAQNVPPQVAAESTLIPSLATAEEKIPVDEQIVVEDVAVEVASAQSDRLIENTEEAVVPYKESESVVIYSDFASTSRPGVPSSVGGAGGGGGGGNTVTSSYEPNTLEQIFLGPQLWLQVLYGTLALFVVVLLFFSIVIEWRRQHPVQIAYGVGLLASMALLFYIHVVVTGGVVIA